MFQKETALAGFVKLAWGFSPMRFCGIGPTFTLTDDMEADIKAMQAFFKDRVGINPRFTSEVER